MKICTKCNELKPLEDYYATSSKKDGHFNECKECTKARVSRHRLENIERIRAYDRERGSLQHRKENVKRTYRKRVSDPEKRRKELDYKKEYRQKNQLKKAANYIAGNAIRNGKLIRKPCEGCGVDKNIHAHHEDYERPLDVTWLCRTCHGQRHKEINEERRNTNKLQGKENP